jgi:Ca2+-binding RTX toxin-like protein
LKIAEYRTVVPLVLSSGVAWAVTKIGTDGPDTLRGTHEDDNLVGKGGNDVLFALRDRDNLLGGAGKYWVLGGDERRPFGGDKNLAGGPGNEGVYGGIGPETVVGGPGNDFLGGDHGSDSVVGGEGPDWLVDGPLDETVKDTVSGDDGDDVIIVNNDPARRDVVSCGGGFDRVAADTKDLVTDDCERVRIGPAVHEELEEMFEELGFVEVFEGLAPDPTVSN